MSDHCSDQSLESVLEYRCCQKVNPVVHLLGFDGSCQQVKCITEHPDKSENELSHLLFPLNVATSMYIVSIIRQYNFYFINKLFAIADS